MRQQCSLFGFSCWRAHTQQPRQVGAMAPGIVDMPIQRLLLTCFLGPSILRPLLHCPRHPRPHLAARTSPEQALGPASLCSAQRLGSSGVSQRKSLWYSGLALFSNHQAITSSIFSEGPTQAAQKVCKVLLWLRKLANAKEFTALGVPSQRLRELQTEGWDFLGLLW